MSVLTADVAAAKHGDLQAFERLINASRNIITSLALTIVKDVDASEEVAQQVFINCWQNLNQLKNDQSFLPWARQSTRYLAINYLRDNRVKDKVTGDQADKLFEQFCTDASLNEQNLAQTQYKRIVSHVLDQLPDDSREIIVLYYREQQSSRQVATLLGISETSVRKKLSRCREKLKSHLLDRFGQVLLSTAPTISFTSITLASLTTSAPAVASVGVGVKSSWLAKLGILFSGAFIASLIGAVAVFFSHKVAEQHISEQHLKLALKKVRNKTIIWLLVSGVLFAASYAFSSGAFWPISVYCLFALGLMKMTKQSQTIIWQGMRLNPRIDVNSKRYRLQKICGSVGLYAGMFVGFGGLIIGLLGAGRL